MALIDILTEAIAGPATVRRSRERALDRVYSTLTEHSDAVENRQVQSNTPDLDSFTSPFRPLTSRRPREGTIRLFRPELHRSQSVQPKAPIIPFQQAEFPPDISAMDLNPEQLKKTYSHSGLWDVGQNPLPPLPHMQGISKYRTSVNADKQWQIEFAKQKLSDLGDCLVQHVVNPMDGMTNEEWQLIKETVVRRDSAISSGSARSEASCEVQNAYDKSRGTCVSRGFISSTTSSEHSSSKEDWPRIRKDSATSISNEPDYKSHQSRPIQSRHVQERKQSSRLTSITELDSQAMALTLSKKLVRTCDFDAKGDPESALASDVSDDEDSEWSDVSQTVETPISGLTRALRESQQNTKRPVLAQTSTNSNERVDMYLGRRKSLERSRTIRALSKTHASRGLSRTGTQKHQKKPVADKPEPRELAPGHISSTLNIASSEASYTEEARASLPKTETKTTNICFDSKMPEPQPPYRKASNFIQRTPALLANPTLAEQRRERSGTAFRVDKEEL